MADKLAERLINEAQRMRYSRRTILHRASVMGLSAAAANAVVAKAGAAPKPFKAPAVLQGSSLNILAATYFVAAGQDHYTERAQAWGAENNVDVTVDYINWPDLQPRIASAVEAGSGPDIIELWDTWPYLYSQALVDLNDMAVRVGEEQGGYFEWVENTASVDGHYFSVPIGASSAAVTYRQSYLAEVGIDSPENFPETWEELFAVGAELKALGRPIGQAFGQSLGDPPGFAYPYMWSHGAMELDEEGNIAINTPEFVEGMRAFIEAWPAAFDETGLGWDDAVNNRAFLSDQISMTINGSSIYATAHAAAAGAVNDQGTPVAGPDVVVDPEDINHASFPAGPAGRFNLLGSRSYGVMSYSENVEAATSYLDWWFAPEEFTAWLDVQEGYIIPPVQGYTELPTYTEDPKLAPYLEVADYARNKGYAGPANQQAAQVFSQYIIVNMFSQAIQTGDPEGPIQEAADQLERIYARRR